MERISDVKTLDRRSGGDRGGDIGSRLSMWTVIGAVCASVATAGILGGASGIMQVPTLATDVAALRSAKDDIYVKQGQVSERVKSNELVGDNLQRQLDVLGRRIDQMQMRMDLRDAADKTSDLATAHVVGELDMRLSKALSELEGRSKDRNTEALGATHALDATIAALQDRLRSMGEALNELRQTVYDLATRTNTQPSLQRPIAPSLRGAPWGFPSYQHNAYRAEVNDTTIDGLILAAMLKLNICTLKRTYGDHKEP